MHTSASSVAYLASIQVPGTVDKSRIELAVPVSGHVINILCGPNNSGKTYILRETRRGVQAHWPQSGDQRIVEHDLRIELAGGNAQPKLLMLLGNWKYKDKAGVVPLERRLPKKPNDLPNFESSFQRFIARQVQSYGIAVDKDFWPDDTKKRVEATGTFELEHKLYITSRHDETVKRIETALGATLYFRRTGSKSNSSLHVELVLVFGNQNAIPYTRWSDGQKAFCYLAILLDDFDPDILLVDELENHLHPAYMTSALELIRSKVAQSIISTHHPHMIFSELVDKVIYVDTDRNNPVTNPETTLDYKKLLSQTAPRRRFVSIENDFGKVAASYKLFHHHDRQLLKQAALVARDAELMFYEALCTAFSPTPLPAASGSFIDTQTKQLADLLSSIAQKHTDHPEFSVLDFGAGVGRIPDELGKDARFRASSGIHWICWEPDETHRKMLQSKTSGSSKVTVVENLDSIVRGSVDLCLMANVIHEISAKQFAGALCQMADKSVGGKPRLEILELYPLIRPEKFAVPYAPTDLVDLLHTLEFECTYQLLQVHGVVAYIVHARYSGLSLELGKTLGAIERLWLQVRARAIKTYRARLGVANFTEYVAMLQDLTTIASIAAYELGDWP